MKTRLNAVSIAASIVVGSTLYGAALYAQQNGTELLSRLPVLLAQVTTTSTSTDTRPIGQETWKVEAEIKKAIKANRPMAAIIAERLKFGADARDIAKALAANGLDRAAIATALISAAPDKAEGIARTLVSYGTDGKGNNGIVAMNNNANNSDATNLGKQQPIADLMKAIVAATPPDQLKGVIQASLDAGKGSTTVIFAATSAIANDPRGETVLKMSVGDVAVQALKIVGSFGADYAIRAVALAAPDKYTSIINSVVAQAVNTSLYTDNGNPGPRLDIERVIKQTMLAAPPGAAEEVAKAAVAAVIAQNSPGDLQANLSLVTRGAMVAANTLDTKLGNMQPNTHGNAPGDTSKHLDVEKSLGYSVAMAAINAAHDLAPTVNVAASMSRMAVTTLESLNPDSNTGAQQQRMTYLIRAAQVVASNNQLEVGKEQPPPYTTQPVNTQDDPDKKPIPGYVGNPTLLPMLNRLIASNPNIGEEKMAQLIGAAEKSADVSGFLFKAKETSGFSFQTLTAAVFTKNAYGVADGATRNNILAIFNGTIGKGSVEIVNQVLQAAAEAGVSTDLVLAAAKMNGTDLTQLTIPVSTDPAKNPNPNPNPIAIVQPTPPATTDPIKDINTLPPTASGPVTGGETPITTPSPGFGGSGGSTISGGGGGSVSPS